MRPCGPELICHLVKNVKCLNNIRDQCNTNPGSYEAQRSFNLEITCSKLKNVHKLENLGHSDLLISVCLDLVSIHIYVRCEGSMINHVSRRGNHSEKENWLAFNNLGQGDLTFHVHILGPYVQICAKYEVSVTQPVARRAVHRH